MDDTFDIDTSVISVGTRIIGYDGQLVGVVHEVHPHYLLVGNDDPHTQFEVPVQSILEVRDGEVRVHVTRESSSVVDEQETAHHLLEGEQSEH